MTDLTIFINKEAHINYFKACLTCLPFHYVGLDTSKISAVYFAVNALDILGALDSIDKHQIVEFIYLMQITPSSRTEDTKFGFIGSSFIGHNLCLPCFSGHPTVSIQPCDLHSNNSQGDLNPSECAAGRFHLGHIAMTYTALTTLLALGDDLSRVDKTAILTGLKSLQTVDGSFKATVGDSENDMRFLYCACAISAVLGDWSGVDKDKAAEYVLSCITYEGGISLIPGVEAHGGACYTGIASLVLMERLDVLTSEQIASLLSWCERKQSHGYQGRTNRDPDSCYAFWIGATIQLLGSFDCTDIDSTKDFLVHSCQRSTSGGFSKLPDTYPDILHSFYSICWLSMAKQEGLRPIDVRLGICRDKSNLL